MCILQWLVVENHQPKFLPTNITILPELLKKSGYTTHIAGKYVHYHDYNIYLGFVSCVVLFCVKNKLLQILPLSSTYQLWKNINMLTLKYLIKTIWKFCSNLIVCFQNYTIKHKRINLREFLLNSKPMQNTDIS